MQNKSKAFIFLGRSGSGKGTQVELLLKALKKADPAHESLSIQTGQALRDFIKGNSYTESVAKKLYDTGGLMSEFLVVYVWVKPLVERYDGSQTLVFDGTPRKVHEAGVLDSVFSFYGIEKPTVINIEISPEEALKRLLLRKRFDDNEEEIKKRLVWFDSDVAKVIGYYKDNPKYRLLTIDGERSIEDIHADIVRELGLK